MSILVVTMTVQRMLTIHTFIYNHLFSYKATKPKKVFHFPGGTIGNYYHFYGKRLRYRYLRDRMRMSRVGTFNFANMFLSFDNKVDKNIISYL